MIVDSEVVLTMLLAESIAPRSAAKLLTLGLLIGAGVLNCAPMPFRSNGVEGVAAVVEACKD